MNFAMNKNQEAKKHSQSVDYYGSSVIGLKYNKGIIIACDTRMCYGRTLWLTSTKQRIMHELITCLVTPSTRPLLPHNGAFKNSFLKPFQEFRVSWAQVTHSPCMALQ